MTFKNSTEVSVQWGHLFHKGGPIKQFDLKVTHQNLRESKVLSVNGSENCHYISLFDLGHEQNWVPDCVNDSITNLYNFSIRAVTYDFEADETYAGDWSPIEVVPAYCERKKEQDLNHSSMSSDKMNCSIFCWLSTISVGPSISVLTEEL